MAACQPGGGLGSVRCSPGLADAFDRPYKPAVKAQLRDASGAEFSDVMSFKNGSVCGMVSGTSDFPGARPFIVGPSCKAIVIDDSLVGSITFRAMQDRFCTDADR